MYVLCSIVSVENSPSMRIIEKQTSFKNLVINFRALIFRISYMLSLELLCKLDNVHVSSVELARLNYYDGWGRILNYEDVSGRFANESFRQRLVRQRLRSTRRWMGKTHGYRTGKKRLTNPFGTGETERLNGLLNILNGLPWTAERLAKNFKRVVMNEWTAY